jgi:hypothetical protein
MPEDTKNQIWDEEHVPRDVTNIEHLVEEKPQEAPCISLEDDEFIEYFIASDKESSHASIRNQDTFEDQVCEENLDEKIIQEFSSSLPQESKGLICYTHFQDFEFYDTYFSNLEEENIMGKPLFDEELDNREIENIDTLLLY